MLDASAALTLTAKGTNSPARASPTCSAIVSPALSWASAVLAPRCGVTTTCGSSNSGDAVVGSVANTSIAAPPMRPSRIASARASSSITPPRDTLTIRRFGLALASSSLADHAQRLGRLDHVQREEVGHADQLVEVEQLDVELAGPLRRHERVVGDHLHAEGRRPLRHQLADAAEPDDAEGLVGQLDALPLRPLPAPVDEGGVGLGDVAGLGQQHGHGVLGGGEDVRLRGVDHHHALLRGGVGVDVVEPDPGPAHHHEVLSGGEHVGRHGGGRADDQRVGAHHGLEQLLGGQLELDVDLVAGRPQAIEPAVGDLLGHQDAGHGGEVWSAPGDTRQPDPDDWDPVADPAQGGPSPR